MERSSQSANPSSAPVTGGLSRLDQDARTLRRLLDAGRVSPQPGPDDCPAEAPALVVLCGLPGTGKSYFAGKLSERLELVVLETDRLRKALVSRPKYTRGEHARVFAVSHLLIEEYLSRGCRVLFDATNLTERAREPLYTISERLGCPLVIVSFTAPVQLVKSRLARRAGGSSAGDYSDATWVIHSRMRPFEEPVQRPHLTVDSSRDIGPVLEQVVALVAAANGAGSPHLPAAARKTTGD